MQWAEPKLLIADDDRDFRESLAEVFRKRGFGTSLAADGKEALEIASQHASTFHLVLMDVHMPRLSGLDAVALLRAELESQVPCILMSANLDADIVRRASELQVASMLSKPFSLRSLRQVVDDILRSSYGWPL